MARGDYGRLIRRIRRFAGEVTSEDCAGLVPTGEPIRYLHPLERPHKHHGGNPPRDYTAVEILVDLQAAVQKDNFEEAIPLYYRLRRMLNWD